MKTRELEEKLSDILCNLQEISLIYLFGSQVTGHLGPMSDYDLGVLTDRGADDEQMRARLTHEVTLAVQTDRVDVVLLNHAPIELAYTVIAQGKVIYQRDLATRVEYEAQVLSRYGDYLPVLRAQRDDILRGDEDANRVHRYRAALGRTERTLGQTTGTQGQDSH